MAVITAPYLQQVATWPKEGRSILAQYDERQITVYQAYRPALGNFAVQYQYFGGEFQLDRMSWIKTSFFWMMYRSGWGTKPGQEVVLAIHILREAFESILLGAVHSTFQKEIYGTYDVWKRLLAQSEVRLQWDPDHSPYGGKIARRAIQIGLRGSFLARYAREWIVEIDDISEFVREQREYVIKRQLDKLVTPKETVYPLSNPEIVKRIGLTSA